MSESVAMKQINVRIPEDLHQALADHKNATGEDKSDVVRRGIEMALNLEPDVQPSQNGAAADGVPPAPAPASEPTSPTNGDVAAAAAESAGDHHAEPGHREGSGSDDSTSDPVDLVEWLAERTDLPRALLRARIGNGRLSVAGRTWHELHIPAALLDQVELDGARP